MWEVKHRSSPLMFTEIEGIDHYIDSPIVHRDNDLGVVRSSVPARAIAVIAFVTLWITGGPWRLLIFAAADLTGLLRSRYALRAGAGPA